MHFTRQPDRWIGTSRALVVQGPEHESEIQSVIRAERTMVERWRPVEAVGPNGCASSGELVSERDGIPPEEPVGIERRKECRVAHIAARCVRLSNRVCAEALAPKWSGKVGGRQGASGGGPPDTEPLVPGGADHDGYAVGDRSVERARE